MIETARLTLRPWREEDRDDLARMCADPNVMVDYPQPQSRTESDARLVRYQETFARHGFCRWALVRREDGAFLGYNGIQPLSEGHPIGAGVEIGWRMVRAAWGFGYASEAARAALHDGFARFGMTEVLSYTTVVNARSQAVMRRIGLVRDSGRDFIHPDGTPYVVFATPRDWFSKNAATS
jgi:RimJ/RimL family protein N-acetyltransferase